MFERRFKEIILSFLGEFIEDFDSSELRVDSWSGQVTQSHLKLKPSALRFLCLMTGLNIEVVRGVIGSLQINFNWRTLWREPIRLTLEDLHILCHPLSQSDPNIFRDRARKQKRSKLDDMLQRRNLENPRKTYWKQLENTISDNIILSLKNVHIRYEDPISNPAAPFALGLTLEKLVLQPCDSHWIKSFITLEQKKAIQKSFTVLELGEFAIYHIAKANELFINKRDWLMSLSHDKFVTLMYQYIAHTKYLPHIAEYYLLRPVNAEIKIRKSLKPPEQSEIPKTTMSIVVEEIAFSLEANQYHDLLMLGSFISLNNTLGEEGQFRPNCRPHDNPRLWWKYAYQVISSRLNKKRAPHRKLYLSIRKVDKEEYMKLYKHKLIREYEEEFERKIGGFEKEARLANAKPEQLDSLLLKIEDRHTMEEIFLFRTMAERDLYWSLDSPKKKGWIEWGRSWFFSNSHNEEEEGYLRALLDYSEMISDVSQAPGNFVKSFINFELKRCSISLAARQLNGLLASFLKITLDKAIIQKRVTKAASHTYAALCSIKVTDPFTPFQKFSHLLHTKNAKELGSVNYEIEEEYFPDDNDGFSEFSKNNFNHTPVFEMTMGNENKDAMSLKVNMEPLEVIYNKHCLERIKRFFRVPEALALYEIIEIQTLNQYSSWKHRTQAKLEYILKKHMNIKLDIHISAPVIIIPLNPMNEDTTQMILDLGLLQVKSKTQDEKLDWTSIRKNSVDIDESEFYDHFDVKVSDINVMLLPPDSFQSWHLVEKFDINLSVSKCIIPKDPHLTTFRIKGRINTLTAKVSKLQFMLLKQYSKDTSISSSLSSSMIVEEMQFKPPKVMSESEEDEFYDVVDPYSDIVEDLAETAYTFPSFKEHLAVEFSINDFNIIILEDRDAEEEEKELLIFTATGLQAQASLEESRKRAGVKLRGIKVEDSLQSPRILVESNEELADLVIIEVCTYLESHPEFSSQQFHTQVTANLNHLQINYHDGNSYFRSYCIHSISHSAS